jgi:hypothetical protein
MLLVACKNESPINTFPSPDEPTVNYDENWDSSLTKEVYYDKLLGALVGSAIGDGMGAPTEMWHRNNIQVQWGYVDGLGAVIREGSPEGPWEDNMAGGSTTDDTRWKYLAGQFLLAQPKIDSLNPKAFAQHIIQIYLNETKEAKAIDAFAPEPLERELMHMTWLQEWAKVAKPYLENDLEGYIYALNRFYGGEMACAGMLYAPLIGAYYPSTPERAYLEAYRLGLFDIGYARDITGMTAALVAKAMQPNIQASDITSVCYQTDPLRYANSRLVGRIAHRIYQDAKYIAYTANNVDTVESKLKLPRGFKRDSLYWQQVQKAYELLDDKLQDIPFHAGEIHLINLTAIEFSQGDFSKAMEFVVNYGRDNDTVAAVTGMILGAFVGFKALPQDIAQQAIRVNRDRVKIDLVKLAEDLTNKRFPKK